MAEARSSSGLRDVTNGLLATTPGSSKRAYRRGKGAAGAERRCSGDGSDPDDANASSTESPGGSDDSASTMDEFCTPLQQMPRSWSDAAPSTSEEPSSSRKSTAKDLQLVCAQQAAEIDRLRAELVHRQHAASACEEELRSEVAAMQQIATERECSRLRLMNEMDEAVKIANLAVQEADDGRIMSEATQVFCRKTWRKRRKKKTNWRC
jgi:hypothetical protein